MAELFQTDRTSIVRHVNNIYKVEELDKESTCAKIAQVQIELFNYGLFLTCKIKGILGMGKFSIFAPLMTAKQLYSELTTWDAQSMLANTIIANVPFEEYVEELIKFKFRNETLSEDLIKRAVKNFVEKVKRKE